MKQSDFNWFTQMIFEIKQQHAPDPGDIEATYRCPVCNHQIVYLVTGYNKKTSGQCTQCNLRWENI